MDGVRLQIDADVGAFLHRIGGLNHPLEAVDVHDGLIMHTHEGDGGHGTLQHAGFRLHDIHILRADDHVHRLVGSKAGIQAVKDLTAEFNLVICQHHAVHNVALADEVSDEGVHRLVVNILRGTDLLNLAFAHDHDGVGHTQGFLLIVGDKDEGDSRGFLDFFQFLLHILAQLQIESTQRLVQQQNLRLVDQRPGNGHTLLLTAGQAGDPAMGKARQHNHAQHFLNLFLDLLFR